MTFMIVELIHKPLYPAATPSCFKLSSNLFSLTTTSCKGSGILVANGQNLITLFFDTLSIRCGSPQFEMLLRF